MRGYRLQEADALREELLVGVLLLVVLQAKRPDPLLASELQRGEPQVVKEEGQVLPRRGRLDLLLELAEGQPRPETLGDEGGVTAVPLRVVEMDARAW